MADEIKNYSNIEIPYDDYLSRGNITTPEGSLESSNGNVETQPVKEGGAMGDIWIKNFIRSNDWSPKKRGFYIDGRTGYAEFSNVFISGNIEAVTGTIGGFTINATSLTATSGGNTTIVSSGATAFSAGPTGSPTITITQAGLVTASNVSITGGTVVTSVLSGTIAQANLNLADRGWTQTSAFSVTDADTIAWGAGTLTSADGTAYSIGAGNTGNMVTKTYIYLDIAVSTIAYQITTTATTAVGVGKVLIAIAQNGTTEATYKVLQGQGGENIDAANIVAGSITANEIAASTITAGKMSVTDLSAISANIGTITTGSLTGITIAIGTANNIFKADSNGIYLGHATFASAPFSVSMAGAVTASNLTITGGTINIGNNSSIDSSGNAIFIGVSTLNMKAYTNFETAGRFVSTVGGSGANSFGNQGVTISPGATATSYSRLLWRISNNVYGNNPTFVATVTALSLNAGSNTGQAFIGLGAPTVSGSAFGFNNSHIGFWIKKVSGIVTVASEQNDGTVGGNVGANIFEIVDNDIIELFIKVTSANVKYYYRKNGGTLTLGDTQTTRIPTGTDEYIMFATTNLDNATNFSFQIFCAAYEH